MARGSSQPWADRADLRDPSLAGGSRGDPGHRVAVSASEPPPARAPVASALRPGRVGSRLEAGLARCAVPLLLHTPRSRETPRPVSRQCARAVHVPVLGTRAGAVA